MNILLLTQVLPYPPDSGPKIKTFNVLKYLAGRHQVYLVSFVRSAAEVERAAALREYCREVVTVPIQRSLVRNGWFLARSLFSRQPFVMVRDESHAMRQAIAGLTARVPFDVVHADQLNMVQYALPLTGVRKVFDAHNAVWTIFQQLWREAPPGPRKAALALEWRKLKWYEGEVGRRCDAILAVSEGDRRDLISAGCPADRFTVIPIAIDTQEIAPVERAPEARAILHVGTMYWPPNVEGIGWFAREVYPLIRAQVPATHFYAVGARPAPEILALDDEVTGVKVTGYVDDVTPYIRESAAFVVPLHVGSGMRVKILTAWAWGIPIVSTTVGCAGIPVHPGEDILIADTAEEFAAAVVRLLREPALGARLVANGRRYVEAAFDWRVACQSLDEVYARMMKAESAGRMKAEG